MFDGITGSTSTISSSFSSQSGSVEFVQSTGTISVYVSSVPSASVDSVSSSAGPSTA